MSPRLSSWRFGSSPASRDGSFCTSCTVPANISWQLFPINLLLPWWCLLLLGWWWNYSWSAWFAPLGCAVHGWVCLCQDCPLWFYLCCAVELLEKKHILHWNALNRTWKKTLACNWKTWRMNSKKPQHLKDLSQYSLTPEALSELPEEEELLVEGTRHRGCSPRTHCLAKCWWQSKAAGSFFFSELLWAWSSCPGGNYNRPRSLCFPWGQFINYSWICWSKYSWPLVCFSIRSNLPSKEEH